MPKKKDWGSTSRQSARLNPIENPAQPETAEDNAFLGEPDSELTSDQSGPETRTPEDQEEDNDDSFQSTIEAASLAEEDQTVLPSVEPTETQDQDPNRHLQREAMSNYSNDQGQQDELAMLRARIAELEAQERTASPPRQQREPTAASAFGGNPNDFVPVGVAAWAAFKRYPGDVNPDYDCKEKSRVPDPEKFTGDREGFTTWLRLIADKLEADDVTYRNEKLCMIYLMNRLDKEARESLETRYQSTTRPFSCLAEMIQVLAAAFHDKNIASKARAELSKTFYKNGKDVDIHRFLAKFGSLAQKAGIPEDQ
jgi:hypothetical protein